MASAFTENERMFLKGQMLARLATVTPKGRPHVVPVIFSLDTDSETINLGAHDLPDRGQNRFYLRNIEDNPRVALVVDDVISTDPWTPRGIELSGRARINTAGGEQLGPGFGPTWVRIVPTWITSWGIEAPPLERPYSRAVSVSHA